jgi:hypothetical protein
MPSQKGALPLSGVCESNRKQVWPFYGGALHIEFSEESKQ